MLLETKYLQISGACIDPAFDQELLAHRSRKAYPCFEEPRGTYTFSSAHLMFFMVRAISWSLKITTARPMQNRSFTSLLLAAFAI